MVMMNVIAVLTVVLFIAGYTKYVQFTYVGLRQEKESNPTHIIAILFIAFLIKLILSLFSEGYSTDMSCWYGWSQQLLDRGFVGFYQEDSFTDYPPGYMYILYIIGIVIKTFNIGYLSIPSLLLMKGPAILFDVLTGYFIYKVAKKRFREQGSILCTLLYLFNPAVVMDSSIWGQVDSVFTFFIVLMCYYVSEGYLEYAFVAYGFGMLVKPQTLMFTPILAFACFEQIFPLAKKHRIEMQERVRGLWRSLIGAVSAILIFIVLSVPFGLGNVVSQYVDTVSSYPKASVNAYNFWTMTGNNWVDQTETMFGLPYVIWGYLFILLVVVSSVVLFFKIREDESRFYILGAYTMIGVFLFSVRMHERYLFPAIVLLLFAFITRPNRKTFVAYTVFTVGLFYNMVYVYLTYPEEFSWEDVPSRLISFGLIAAFVYFIVIIYQVYYKSSGIPEKKQVMIAKDNGKLVTQQPKKQLTIEPTKPSTKILRLDFTIMIIVTCVYALFALHDLGYQYAPETQWESNQTGSQIVLDLGKDTDIAKLTFYSGNYENRRYTVQVRDSELEDWTTLSSTEDDTTKFTMCSVFRWDSWEINQSARYIRLISLDDKANIRELIVYDSNNSIVTPVNATTYSELFDEAEMYDYDESFRTGTYFDEIYHARTAYEYMHGLYSYENTHPPLGKIFIALGMCIFGVNPFGWRIMGTLFGIAMLPLIYLFGKRMFKQTWIATVITVLFAADFMHFAQTRIATIDVFITFFVILMYYFMYRYIQMSFYDTKLWKTFIPLGLCGISMGLGVACKVTGVYAGVGLAIIFFMHLYKRYREYQYALKKPQGTTNGISHQTVIDTFQSNTIKTLLFCIVFFVIVPCVIFLLSYLPFRNGTEGAGLVERTLGNIESMYSYHTSIEATHPFSSWWYEWPIMVRPIWYYSYEVSSTVAEGISAFGNPIVWWGGIAAFAYMCYLIYKDRDKTAIFLVIAYLAQYLPWFLVTRITFIYHYFPSIPFVILMLVYSFYNITKKYPKFKYGIFGITVVACILFILFYPVLSGQPVSKDYVSTCLRWFDSWVLLSR